MADNEGKRSAVHPLRKARKARNLSMRAAAGQAGINHRRFYEWEVGQHVPTLPYAQLIAPVLGFESGAAVRDACRAWITEHALTGGSPENDRPISQ